jgi:Hyaluronidase
VILFDALLFAGKPDLAQWGLRPIKIIPASQFFPTGADRALLPASTTVRAASTDVRDLAVVNVEHWQDTTLYVTLLKCIHRLMPNLRVGFYDIVPKRDYWRAIRGEGDPKYSEWQAVNDSLKPIAKEADALFPSLYTFYPDQAGWIKYASANIAEAKRYNKTVYPFLWPQYHDSNALLKWQLIPGDYWRLQLETLKSLAVDGIVIWGGSEMPWDEAAPWWQVTKEFLGNLKNQ